MGRGWGGVGGGRLGLVLEKVRAPKVRADGHPKNPDGGAAGARADSRERSDRVRPRFKLGGGARARGGVRVWMEVGFEKCARPRSTPRVPGSFRTKSSSRKRGCCTLAAGLRGFSRKEEAVMGNRRGWVIGRKRYGRIDRARGKGATGGAPKRSVATLAISHLSIWFW